MADATDLKSVDRKVVRVRLPPSAPIIAITYNESSVWISTAELTPLESHSGTVSQWQPNISIGAQIREALLVRVRSRPKGNSILGVLRAGRVRFTKA
jgi:hypothetical protein